MNSPASGQHGRARIAVESRSIDCIPDSERHARLADQGPFWFLGNFHFFTLSIGFVGPSLGLSAPWSALAGTLGIMFGTLFMALHGAQGPQLGLPQMIQSRAQFGFRGVTLPLCATLLVFTGFNVVNVSLIMQGMQAVFGLPPAPTACVAVAVGALLAVCGHDVMHKAFRCALMLALPLYALATLALLAGVGEPALHVRPEPLPGFAWSAFAAQFTIAASYNISYAPYVSDYSRYLPRHTAPRRLIAAIFLGASLSGAWMIGLGAWMAQRLQAGDALAALGRIGTGLFPGADRLLPALAVVAFVPIIALNTYSAALTVLTAADSLGGLRPTRSARGAREALGTLGARIGAIAAISATILACVLSIQGSGVALLHSFLALLLYFLVPWTAVNLVDYFLVRKGRYAIADFFTPQGIYGAWGWRGICAYLGGFAAMVPFFHIHDATDGHAVFIGWAAQRLGGVDFAWLPGILVAGSLYWVLARNLDLQAEEAASCQSRQDSHPLHLKERTP